jgi:hypothetical protein
MAGTSALATLTNILVAPNEAFASIRERPSAWLPLVAIVLGTCVTQFLYLSEVDMGWLVERQMDAAAERGAIAMTEEQRAQAIEAQANMPRAALFSITSVSSTVIIVAIMALVALYVFAVSLKFGLKYKQWFALVAWCSLPVVLGMLAQIANLLVTDARFMPQEALNPLSFGNLLGIEYQGRSALQTILLYLDPTTVWALVLQILGYQAWTKRTTLTSALIVLAPTAAIFALVAIASR